MRGTSDELISSYLEIDRIIGCFQTGTHASSVHWNSSGSIIQSESVLLRATLIADISIIV